MPNYEDFKRYGEMTKQAKQQPPSDKPAAKPKALARLFGKAKLPERGN
ncbi:MAG: hypothetical protein ACT4OM_11800 [Actinomycetota bacterium]